jgi:hypothetical protein
VRLLIAFVVWAAAVVGAVAVSSVVADGIHNRPAGSASSPGVGSGSSTAGSSFSGGGSGSADPSSIRAADRASLFRTANFSNALAKARAALGAGAKIDNFALYPGYLSVTLVKGGGEVNFYADANGRVEQTATGGSPGGRALFPLSRIGAGVPAAVAHRISSAAHVPTSQLHYMVIEVDPVSGHGIAWLVYPLRGNRVEYFKTPGATGQLLEYRSGSSSGLQPVS